MHGSLRGKRMISLMISICTFCDSGEIWKSQHESLQDRLTEIHVDVNICALCIAVMVKCCIILPLHHCPTFIFLLITLVSSLYRLHC